MLSIVFSEIQFVFLFFDPLWFSSWCCWFGDVLIFKMWFCSLLFLMLLLLSFVVVLLLWENIYLQISISFCVTYFFCVFSSILILEFICVLFGFVKNSRIEIIVTAKNDLSEWASCWLLVFSRWNRWRKRRVCRNVEIKIFWFYFTISFVGCSKFVVWIEWN